MLIGNPEESAPDEQMVHRPSDSRLLSNLISHEKDYSKHLQSLLDSSHASLASFSAFAAASAQPISRVIHSIAGDFSVADNALRRYKDAVDAWREQLKLLKDMESDIMNVVRDKDILYVVSPCGPLNSHDRLSVSLVYSKLLKTKNHLKTKAAIIMHKGELPL